MSTQQAPRMSALIGLVASSTALSALGIDAILPALPVIGSEMHVAVENRLQWAMHSSTPQSPRPFLPEKRSVRRSMW